MSIYDMLAKDRREPPLCGITVGVVTDIKDPDRKNRVKVRLINRTDSAQETDLIRVMTPAAVQDGKNEVRMMKSKTAHKLELNDGEDAPGITLVTAKETRLAMDDKAQTAELGDKDGKNHLKIDIGGGTVTLEAKTKLVLKCGKAEITLDGGSGEISIKTSGNIKIDGQQMDVAGKSAVNVKASGQLNLEASGPANLKGAIVKMN